ncbi:unnamed protein product, partial [Heterosigma akashiwo]
MFYNFVGSSLHLGCLLLLLCSALAFQNHAPLRSRRFSAQAASVPSQKPLLGSSVDALGSFQLRGSQSEQSEINGGDDIKGERRASAKRFALATLASVATFALGPAVPTTIREMQRGGQAPPAAGAGRDGGGAAGELCQRHGRALNHQHVPRRENGHRARLHGHHRRRLGLPRAGRPGQGARHGQAAARARRQGQPHGRAALLRPGRGHGARAGDAGRQPAGHRRLPQGDGPARGLGPGEPARA